MTTLIKLLVLLILMEGAHAWAKRWTWCWMWLTVGLVVAAYETLAVLTPPLWMAVLITAGWLIPIGGCMVMSTRSSKKKTLTREFRELWDKKNFPNDYAPVKGVICIVSDFAFLSYLCLLHITPLAW